MCRCDRRAGVTRAGVTDGPGAVRSISAQTAAVGGERAGMQQSCGMFLNFLILSCSMVERTLSGGGRKTVSGHIS